jgi:dipeptidyl aminopeptidase/acylaminoacyl peptidase
VARAAEGKVKPELVLDPGGHTAQVKKVLFTPNGKELITVGEDKTVRFWDAAGGAPLRTLYPPAGKGDQGRLFAAALSRDGLTLAVAGYGWDGGEDPVYLIDVPTGQMRRLLKGHTNTVHALAFSRDGRLLASASADRTARIWEVRSGTCKQALTGHTRSLYGVAFAPDGRRLVTASHDATARLWSVSARRSEAVLRGHRSAVRCVTWSPDGKTIATGSYDLSIRLWESDGTFRKAFDDLGNTITSLAFDRNARTLLFTRGSLGPHVCSVLGLASGREITRFRQHDNTVLHGALSPDGILAATAGGNDHQVYVWKRAGGTTLHRLAGRGRAAWAAGWSKDGKAIAWGNTNVGRGPNTSAPLEQTFQLADLEPGPAPADDLSRARTASGSLTLALTTNNTIAVREDGDVTARLKVSPSSNAVRCFSFLSRERVAVGTNFGLYLFETRTGKRLREFQGHTGTVWAVAPSPDNRYLLSASDDQTLRIWRPDRDEPLLSLFFAGDDWIAWTAEGYYACSAGGEKLMGWRVSNGKEKMASFHPAARFRASLYRPDVIKLLLKTGSVEKALAAADKPRGKMSALVGVPAVLPPRVVITAPGSGARLSKAEVEVKATATSVGKYAVRSLRLLLDGRPYKGEAGIRNIAASRLGAASASWTVTLTPGRHKLAVLADSEVSQGRSAEITVSYRGGEAKEEKAPKPTLYILAIGVAKYKAEKLRLNYSARDAEAVVRAFQKHSTSLFKNVHARTLTDKKATRAGILKGVKWLREQMTQRDYAVVFFSGHGERDSDGGLFFLPFDVDPDDLLSTAVPARQFMNPLVALPGKILVLLDACHSGGIDGGKRKSSRSLTDDLVRDLVRDESGLAVMCSSTGREFSLENNTHRMSNFSLAVVEGLSGKARKAPNGAVYLHHLDAYVTDRVKALSKGKQHPVTSKPSTIASFPLAKP